MKTEFKSLFLKDIEALGDARIRTRIRKVIQDVEGATGLHEIADLKKLRGAEDCYRIRVGDFRLGLVIQEDTVVFVRCLHRKDIYRHLP